MIETHAHVYDEQFDTDRPVMLQRASDVGISEVWLPNCDASTIEPMLQVEQDFPICKAMMGLHPCYVGQDFEAQLATVAKWLAKRKFIMIGEIGLDFFWDLTYGAEQEKAFVAQLELAKQYNLPICIHSRNSKDGNLNAITRCCELIENFDWEGLRGIFHCFSGNLAEAQRIISLNFLLGIGGVATFKNGGLDAVLPYISLENIVLETDSPYLAPVPFRGKRNEVAYLDLVSERIALLMGETKTTVVVRTTQNAHQLIDSLSIN